MHTCMNQDRKGLLGFQRSVQRAESPLDDDRKERKGGIVIQFQFSSDSLFTKFYNKESVSKAVSIQT